MKKLILSSLIAFLFLSCDPPPQTVTITIGDKRDLAALLPAAAEGLPLIWTSSDSDIVRITDDGIATAVKFASGGSEWFVTDPATGTAIITVQTEDGKFQYDITVVTTTEGQINMLELPPLKDQFAEYFMMGNIFSQTDTAYSGSEVYNKNLIHHFNILTPENNMKPAYLSQHQGSYLFGTADNMVNAAIASGFKVHGHTLLWHSQLPNWQRNLVNSDRETALALMREYLTAIVSHFAGRIYSWDILNEVFPDGVNENSDWKTSMRKVGDSQGPNPWFVAIGSDFVYEAYLAARRADPNAILYYNDYNTDQRGKATMIHNMVRDVNARYAQAFPNERRLLIEGIGMQEHHNINVSVYAIENTINLFRPLGVRLSVAELDVLGQGWSEFSPVGSGAGKSGNSRVTNNGIIVQATKYNEYMRLYLANSDIIERVSLWGVSDNRSWRSGGVPLLFDSEGRAKPAYYSFIRALEQNNSK